MLLNARPCALDVLSLDRRERPPQTANLLCRTLEQRWMPAERHSFCTASRIHSGGCSSRRPIGHAFATRRFAIGKENSIDRLFAMSSTACESRPFDARRFRLSASPARHALLAPIVGTHLMRVQISMIARRPGRIQIQESRVTGRAITSETIRLSFLVAYPAASD